MKFNQITIIGVGLIGGSIGMAVKKQKLATRVIGVTAHKTSLKRAMQRKAIDFGTMDARRSVLGSDMVILATPVNKILPMLWRIKPYLKDGCVVIDVASVKGAIVKNAEKIIGSKACFVGTHPMAGSEERGVDRADSDLFKGTPCIVTKTSNTYRNAFKAVESFWKRLGSKIYELSPAEHDKKVSNISHLPHAVAAALSLATDKLSLKFASTGFRDVTRIASSDPDLWTSILMSNRSNVVGDIESYIKQLENVKCLVLGGEKNKLRKMLLKAKNKRDSLM